MRRVIAIGIDAADRSLVEELAAAGTLPHLAALRARGASVELRSAVPYRAEFPWTEFATGRTAESLRYWGTVDFDPLEYAAYMQGASTAEPFYALGDAATVLAFDLPKVVRSDAVHGVQALGWGAHSPQYPVGSKPAGALDDITRRFGTSPALPIEYAGSWNQPGYLEDFGRAQCAAVKTRGDIVRWLASEHRDWDLILTLVGECHQTGHMLAHGFGGLLSECATAPTARRAMVELLEAIDRMVGDVVAWAPDDAVIAVFSVHGMTSADDETAASLIPELLFRAAAGTSRLQHADLDSWRRRGAPAVVPPEWDTPLAQLNRQFGVPAREARRRTAKARVHSSVQRIAPGLLRARRLLRRGPPGDEADSPALDDGSGHTTFPFRDVSMNAWHMAAWYRDAWSRMPAFAIPTFSDVHIRINLEGRERAGIVPPAGYKAACDDVERILRAGRDGRSGEPLVLDVFRMRHDDPHAPDGPSADLVVQLAGTDALEHPELGNVGPLPALRTGDHTADGFAYLVGPGIVPGDRGRHPVCDLSATIRSLLGTAAGPPLDGRSILHGSQAR